MMQGRRGPVIMEISKDENVLLVSILGQHMPRKSLRQLPNMSAINRAL